MKPTSSFITLTTIVLLAASSMVARSQEQTNAAPDVEIPQAERALLVNLLDATEKDDFKMFMADADSVFKTLPKSAFESVARQLASRLKNGYDITYFGELKQAGYRATVWKLKFHDGRDDELAEVSSKNGKVGGFWIQ